METLIFADSMVSCCGGAAGGSTDADAGVDVSGDGWTPRSTAPTSTGQTFPAAQGDVPNYKKLWAEPQDHAVGHPRGGLSTKIHHACDGKGPDAVTGDQGLLLQGQPQNAKAPGGGRPVDFDSEAYKRRSAVEQSFNIFKQWRSIATRSDKFAITYR